MPIKVNDFRNREEVEKHDFVTKRSREDVGVMESDGNLQNTGHRCYFLIELLKKKGYNVFNKVAVKPSYPELSPVSSQPLPAAQPHFSTSSQ